MTKQILSEDIYGKTSLVDVDKLSFRPAVYGVIVEDKKILLSKQWGGYDFPGGGIDLGEDIDTALNREIKEETGFDVEVGKILLAGNSFFKLPNKDKHVHTIFMYYECKIVGGVLSTENLSKHEKTYAQMAEWIELEKIFNLKIHAPINVRQLLDQYL